MPERTLEWSDIKTIAEESLSQYERTIGSSVEIVKDLGRRVPKVKADRDEVKRVFLNVIENAVQAMPEGGRLEVTCLKARPQRPDGRRKTLKPGAGYEVKASSRGTGLKSPDYVEVAFTDTGTGVSPENAQKLFMTAKIVDTKRRTGFKVMVLPNLCGDILTGEAAEFQGGVGTAGSANIGKRYAMFEAIHGSAPRMVKENRARHADPSSMVRAGSMMLNHIGFPALGKKLQMALDICGQYEKNLVMTGRSTGATSKDFVDYILATVQDPNLEKRWNDYTEKEKQKASQ
jgi:hypothetical protein